MNGGVKDRLWHSMTKLPLEILFPKRVDSFLPYDYIEMGWWYGWRVGWERNHVTRWLNYPCYFSSLDWRVLTVRLLRDGVMMWMKGGDGVFERLVWVEAGHGVCVEWFKMRHVMMMSAREKTGGLISAVQVIFLTRIWRWVPVWDGSLLSLFDWLNNAWILGSFF